MRTKLLAFAAYALAALVAFASAAGLMWPAAYARETPSWRAQAVGQDWYDLVVLVPFLVACGAGLRRGSRTAVIALAGAVMFTFYTFVIYTMAVHFNALFLVYCAAFGLSFFALVGSGVELATGEPRAWVRPRAPLRVAGGFLVTTAGLFGLMWLADVVPALVRGTSPPALAEVGLVTNPVHVLDLSIMIPASLIAGVSLLRGRRLGLVLAPALLVFTLLMLLSIAALFVVMHLRGAPSNLVLAAVLAVVAGVAGFLAARMTPRSMLEA